MRTLKLVLVVLLVGLLVPVLSGCAGTKTHESTGEYFDDSIITNKAKLSILGDPKLKFMNINVETFKGVVQLSGFVNSSEEATRATDLVRRIRGVRQVNNSLIVK